MNCDHPNETEERQMLLLYLKHEVLLLAMPGAVMLEIFRNQKSPCLGDLTQEAYRSFLEAVAAEEITIDFHLRLEAVMHHLGNSLTVAQKGCMAALNAFFDAMSGPSNERLYSPEAVLESQEWSIVRRLATMIAGSFGWDIKPPIHYGWSYCDYRWRDELPELSIPEA